MMDKILLNGAAFSRLYGYYTVEERVKPRDFVSFEDRGKTLPHCFRGDGGTEPTQEAPFGPCNQTYRRICTESLLRNRVEFLYEPDS